jgi:hypothetical protein
MTVTNVFTETTDKRPRQRLRATANPMAHAFTIEDAQSIGAPGRTKIYALAKTGKLRLIRVAGRTMVDGNSLRALLGVQHAA